VLSKLEKIVADLVEPHIEVSMDRVNSFRPRYTFIGQIAISRMISTEDISHSHCKYCLVRRTLIRMYRDVIQMCERRIEALED